MPTIIKLIIAFALSAIGVGVNEILKPLTPVVETNFDERYKAIGGFGNTMSYIYRYVPPVTTTEPVAPIYRHGDCSWLPAVALQAGWQVDQIEKLTKIAMRESGCCIRLGGQTVDKDCNITGTDGTSHSSDTSILQLNGINWDIKRNPQAVICLRMGICTQEPLLDPLTNLRAGKVLFDYWQEVAGDGWIPWDMCNRTNTCK